MNTDKLNCIIDKTNKLIEIPFCSGIIKSAAKVWLDSIGTESEEAETKKYIDVLKAEILPIDSAIAFAESEKGISILGEKEAKNVAEHSRKRKAEGSKYCGCPACALAEEIINKC